MHRSLVMSCILLAGCERVVDVTLPEGPRRLVIEARLERVIGQAGGAQQIRLSTTAPYLSPMASVPARGAVVRITDDSGSVTSLAESSISGSYTSAQLPITVGRRYTLTINFEGQRYEATETAMGVPPIDTLYFSGPLPTSAGPTTGMRATIDFADPPGIRNYYLWDQVVNGRRIAAPDTGDLYRPVIEDVGIDGVSIGGFQPYDGVVIDPGSTVRVRQIGISAAAYRYYIALSNQSSNDGSPFAIPASSVRSNIANVTTPALFPVGYFQVSEVAEAVAVLP